MLSAKSKSYQTSLKFACLVMDAKKWKNEGWGTLWDNITHIRTGCCDDVVIACRSLGLRVFLAGCCRKCRLPGPLLVY